MSMTDIRRKAQDKLRRKFGYKSNDNYGRGTILYKGNESKNAYNQICDLNIIIGYNAYNCISETPEPESIELLTTSYIKNGNEFKVQEEHHVFLSLEELDLIHTIAHQMAEEGKWDDQIKEYKKYKKELEAKNIL